MPRPYLKYQVLDSVSYRDSIRSMYHRWQKRINASPSRSQSSSHCHINDKWLHTLQRKAKLSTLQHRTKLADKKIKYLQKKIAALIEKRGVDVDDSLQTGLENILAEQTNIVRKQYAMGSFHRLFWDQQIEAMSKCPTQRRWHPTLIHWCLSLKMKSTAAYDALRGVLMLPCGRTLQDYTR